MCGIFGSLRTTTLVETMASSRTRSSWKLAFTNTLWCLICGERSSRRFLIGGLLLGCLIVAFGYYTPLYHILYYALPMFGSFRGVSKVVFLSALFLALLAGIGLDRILRGGKLTIAPPIVLAIVAIILLARPCIHDRVRQIPGCSVFLNQTEGGSAAGRVLRGSPQDFRTMALHRASMEMLWGGVTCATLAFLWNAARLRRAWALGILAVAAAELLIFAWGNRPTFELTELEKIQSFINPSEEAFPPDSRVISGHPSEVLVVGGDEAWGNDPMILRRYAEFMALNQDATADQLIRRGFPYFKYPSHTWRIVRIVGILLPAEHGERWKRMPIPPLPRGLLIEDVRVITDDSRAAQYIGRSDFRSVENGPRRIAAARDPSAPGQALPATSK